MSSLSLKLPSLLRSQSYINGEWIPTEKNKTFKVTNPATGELIQNVSDHSVDLVKKAIDIAHDSQKEWAKYTSIERSEILFQWYNLIKENKEDLSRLLTAEQGKPLNQSRTELDYGASFVKFYAQEILRVRGDVYQPHKPDRRILVLKQPIGVFAAITPWNYPIAMVTRKLAPGIAAGCTAVLKPAPETPLSALALMVLAEKAGIPKGVINVITSEDPSPIGNEMTSNPKIKLVTFTGSLEVGHLLMRQSSATLKRVCLELGGNSPVIVFDDADLDKALESVLAVKFTNSGQMCVAANRIFVHSTIYDKFVAAYVAKVKELKVGEGLNEASSVGPLINSAALEKVEELVGGAISSGAKVLQGGKRHSLGMTFYEPTVISEVTPKMGIFSSEIFGPVASFVRFNTEEEVIAMANDTQYGLAAYFHSNNASRIWRVAEALDSGIVVVNDGLFSNVIAPFGGIKQSGFGIEGSTYGLEEFLRLKQFYLHI